MFLYSVFKSPEISNVIYTLLEFSYFAAFNKADDLTTIFLFLVFKIIAIVECLNMPDQWSMLITDFLPSQSLITFVSKSITQHGLLLTILAVNFVHLGAMINETKWSTREHDAMARCCKHDVWSCCWLTWHIGFKFLFFIKKWEDVHSKIIEL